MNKQKLTYWLTGALAISALVGCSSTNSGGDNGGYQTDSGVVQRAQDRVGDRDVGSRANCATGAPYESQHLSPSQQMPQQ